MAAITESNVSRISGHSVGDRFGVHIERVQIFDVTLSSQGGTANDIPASVFGLTKINWAQCVRAVDGSSALATVGVMVEADDEGILIADPENSTDATRGNAGNYTGVVRIRLGGN